jgi:hypothetical protein
MTLIRRSLVAAILGVGLVLAVPACSMAERTPAVEPAATVRDTPGRLAAWAAETRLDTTRWTLLSGSDDDVRELAATIDVRYQRQPGGEMAHTNAIVVLDARGVIAHQHSGLGSTSQSERAVAGVVSKRTLTSSASTLE